MEKGSHITICTHILYEKRRRKRGVLSDWCQIPKRTCFSKYHMTKGRVILGSSTHNSQKRRPLCLEPQQKYSLFKSLMKLCESHFKPMLLEKGMNISLVPPDRGKLLRRLGCLTSVKLKKSVSHTINYCWTKSDPLNFLTLLNGPE